MACGLHAEDETELPTAQAVAEQNESAAHLRLTWIMMTSGAVWLPA